MNMTDLCLLPEHTAKDFDGKSIEFSTTKTVRSIEMIDEGSGYFRIEFVLESALYRMVRNIVGTCLFVRKIYCFCYYSIKSK